MTPVQDNGAAVCCLPIEDVYNPEVSRLNLLINLIEENFLYKEWKHALSKSDFDPMFISDDRFTEGLHKDQDY